VTVAETERLLLRRIEPADAEFILTLLNEPSFLRFIGDRNVRNVDDARGYIANGPADSYDRNGFGLYLVVRRDDGAPLGMCGLLKRETLDDVDLGFAFLPAYWGKGYAREAATATLAHARDAIGLRRVVAITSVDNEASIGLLGRLGFAFERMTRLGDGDEIRLFALELEPAAAE
jgi:RimJ/RimL family protein N-acetyltransferase